MYSSLPCNPFIDDLKPEFGLIDVNRDLTAELGCLFGMPMAEGGGTTVRDVVGGYDGTITGATWVRGQDGYALSFNGSSNYVSITNVPALNISTPISVSARVVVNAWPAGGQFATIAEKGYNGSTEGWYLHLSDSGGGGMSLRFGSFTGVVNEARWVFGSAWNLGERHHIVGTWTGAEWRIYFDGALVQSATNSTGPQANSQNVYLGASNISSTISRFLTGTVSDARIHNNGLTVSQNAALYMDPWALYRQDRRNVFAVSSFVPAPYYYQMIGGGQ